MSKANGVMGAIRKVLTYFLIVLFVLGIAGGVSFFVLRNQGITYYVEYGGKKYYANGGGGSLWLSPSNVSQTFSVKSLTGGEVNYSVKVTANSANNFTFVYDGKLQKFFGTDETANDYSEVFGLKKAVNEFMLTVPKDFTVEQAVEAKYGGDIAVQGELNNDYCYFVITVTVEKSKVNLWFNFSPMEIMLNPSQIVF